MNSTKMDDGHSPMIRNSATDIDALRLHLSVYSAVEKTFRKSVENVKRPSVDSGASPSPPSTEKRSRNQASEGLAVSPSAIPALPSIANTFKEIEHSEKVRHDRETAEVRDKLISEKMAFSSWEAQAHHKLEAVETRLKSLEQRMTDDRSSHEKSIEALRHNREEIETEIVHSIEDSLHEIKRQADMQTQFDTTTKDLLERIGASRRRVDTLKLQQETMAHQLRVAEQETMEERSARRTLLDRTQDMEDQFSKLTKQYEAMYATVVRENDHLKQQVRDLKDEVSHMKKIRQHPHQVESVLRAKIAELRAELHGEAERRATAETRLRMMDQQHKESRKFGAADGTRKVLEEELSSLRTQLGIESKNRVLAESAFEKSDAELRTLLIRYETDMNAASGVKDSLKSELGSLRTDYELCLKDLSDMKVKYEKLTQQYENERSRVRARLQQLEEAWRFESGKKDDAEKQALSSRILLEEMRQALSEQDRQFVDRTNASADRTSASSMVNSAASSRLLHAMPTSAVDSSYGTASSQYVSASMTTGFYGPHDATPPVDSRSHYSPRSTYSTRQSSTLSGRTIRPSASDNDMSPSAFPSDLMSTSDREARLHSMQAGLSELRLSTMNSPIQGAQNNSSQQYNSRKATSPVTPQVSGSRASPPLRKSSSRATSPYSEPLIRANKKTASQRSSPSPPRSGRNSSVGRKSDLPTYSVRSPSRSSRTHDAIPAARQSAGRRSTVSRMSSYSSDKRASRDRPLQSAYVQTGSIYDDSASLALSDLNTEHARRYAALTFRPGGRSARF